MIHSLDDQEMANYQMAHFMQIDVECVRDWTNSDFYDAVEYMHVQNEVDRRFAELP